MTKTIPRIVPTGTIMKKLAITRKLTIALRSRQRGGLVAVTRPRRPPRPTEGSTKTGALAADLLQVQPLATIDAIHDCRLGKPAAEPRMTETRREIALSPRNACLGGRPWAFNGFRHGRRDSIGPPDFAIQVRGSCGQGRRGANLRQLCERCRDGDEDGVDRNGRRVGRGEAASRTRRQRTAGPGLAPRHRQPGAARLL